MLSLDHAVGYQYFHIVRSQIESGCAGGVSKACLWVEVFYCFYVTDIRTSPSLQRALRHKYDNYLSYGR
jgi:hypothetical protein